MCKFTIIILLTLTLSTISINSYAQNVDTELLRGINQITETEKLSQVVSNTTTITSLSVPVVMGVVALVEKDDDLLKKTLYVGASIGVSGVLTYGLKHTIKRPRPYVVYDDIVNRSVLYGTDPQLSFPSGHTSLAFATATSLTLAYPKWYVAAPGYLWACYVGYSRMNLGVHYPSDVLAGAVLGAGSAYVTYKINNWFWKKQNNRKLMGLQAYIQ